MAKSKGLKTTHTSNSKLGMGNFNGTSVKNPVGKIKTSYMTSTITPKKAGKPPKSFG